MNRYQLPWHKRRHDRLKHTAKTCAWIALCAIVVTGFWYSLQERDRYAQADRRIAEAEAKIAQAERTAEELFDVLNGNTAMVDTEFGSKYAVIERVTWEVRK